MITLFESWPSANDSADNFLLFIYNTLKGTCCELWDKPANIRFYYGRIKKKICRFSRTIKRLFYFCCVRLNKYVFLWKTCFLITSFFIYYFFNRRNVVSRPEHKRTLYFFLIERFLSTHRHLFKYPWGCVVFSRLCFLCFMDNGVEGLFIPATYYLFCTQVLYEQRLIKSSLSFHWPRRKDLNILFKPHKVGLFWAYYYLISCDTNIPLCEYVLFFHAYSSTANTQVFYYTDTRWSILLHR